MNTDEMILTHSKEKLSIYIKYLTAYLNIMVYSPFFKHILVIEPFAGKGMSKNGEKGSAKLAQEVIEDIRKKTSKPINLILNDNNCKSCSALKDHLNMNDNNLSIMNKDANDCILNILSKTNLTTHHLFYLDPFGYTQIHKATYEHLFSQNHLDLLVFIPVSFIYRFFKTKKKDEPQLVPIQKFLADFEINEEVAKSCTSCEKFIQKIVEALKKKANSDFVYVKEIKNESSNSLYGLFFITKHIYGAEKFLETLHSISRKYPDLFMEILSDLDQEFIKKIKTKNIWTNQELYEAGIKNAFLPIQVNKILRNLEDNKEIIVQPLKKRNRGSFYIGYDHYYHKEKEPKLKILVN